MSEQPDWADSRASIIGKIVRTSTPAEADELVAFHLRVVRQEGIVEGLTIAEHAITSPADADAADCDPEPS